MNKFLIKVFLFVFPLLLLHAFTFIYYSPDKGDLLRIGYIIDKYPDYRRIFSESFKNDLKVTSVSEISASEEYDLLTIGDSFSEQGNVGYQNYLALDHDLNVVHIDRYFHTNQVQTLIGLANSDFFDRYHFRFVLLQFIEAGSHGIANIVDKDSVLLHDKFKDKTQTFSLGYTRKIFFPSDRVIKFPYYSIKRILFPDLDCNYVYSLRLRTNKFSENEKNLYFHSFNPKFSNNNDEEDIKKLNNLLNKLADKLNKKGVKLIVMPVPDKLDYYFDAVEDSNEFQKTRFFDILIEHKKDYIYLDSFSGLKQSGSTMKDVYYFDDTHWSPVGSKLIAQMINDSIS